jgi:hypothetical protein
VTFSAPGFKFLPTVQVRFGTKQAAVTALSADSLTITVLPPIGANGVATITNAVLAFLVEVPLAATPSTGTLTTPGTYMAPALPNTGTATASSPTMNVGPLAPGGGIFDGGAWSGSSALGGLGNAGGPVRWYRLVVTGATRARPVSLDWPGGADMDLYITKSAVSAITASSAGASQPEATSASLAAGTFYIAGVNWSNLATPDWIFIVVQ